MKKIIIYAGTLASGGAEHQISNLANFLVEEGYDVSIITFMYETPDYYWLDSRIKRMHLAPGKKPFVKILALIHSVLFCPSSVIISWGQMQSVFILLALLFRPDIKVICGERNYTKYTPNIFEKILYLGLYRRAKYIVANSYTQRDYQIKKHPTYKNKLMTILNYTDLDEYKIEQSKSTNKKVRIGIFCRFEKQKNFVRFVDAINLLVKSGETNFIVDWYGNHSFKNREQIDYYNKGLELIASNKLQEYIRIHDAVRNVSELIPQFDVLCLASLYEGFSNSIGEYICCGRPVLCSDVSDNSLMVHDGINGFLFDPNNINSIKDALKSFISLPKERKDKMGVESRKIAESIFKKENFIQGYIRLINE